MLAASIMLLVLGAEPTQKDILKVTCEKFDVCDEAKNDAHNPDETVVEFLKIKSESADIIEMDRKNRRLEREGHVVFPTWGKQWITQCSKSRSGNPKYCKCLYAFAWVFWDDQQLSLILRNAKLDLYAPKDWFEMDDKCFDLHGKRAKL